MHMGLPADGHTATTASAIALTDLAATLRSFPQINATARMSDSMPCLTHVCHAASGLAEETVSLPWHAKADL